MFVFMKVNEEIEKYSSGISGVPNFVVRHVSCTNLNSLKTVVVWLLSFQLTLDLLVT